MIIRNNYLKNYNILEKYTAGIVLEGWEVKTLKIFKNIIIKNSYILNINNEIFLKNSFIYKENIKNYKINRNRKLLLKKNEIKKILKKIKNFKIVPFSIFLKNNIIKIDIVIILKSFHFKK